jgi:hypothetical protein
MNRKVPVLATTTLAALSLISVQGVRAQEPGEPESLFRPFHAPKDPGRLHGQRQVFPTGEFPADVENVQAAVDQGGVVLLKATNRVGEPTAFDFGPADSTPRGSVLLERDVWVRGEARGSHRTTIEGGYAPFFGRGGHVRIEGIDFEGPQLSAIRVVGGTGAEVIGNRITGVVPALATDPPYFPPSGWYPPDWVQANAITFQAFSSPITGKVVVAGNVIQDVHVAGMTPDFYYPDGAGIYLDGVEAAVDIEANRIAGVDLDGIRLFDSRGAVRVTDNFVGPGGVIGQGIAIANYTVEISDSFDIERNVVICGGEGEWTGWADCIYLLGFYVTIDAPVVAQNHVTMHAAGGGITFYGNVSHARVANNRIDGDGYVAFPVVGIGDVSVAESNRFIGNDISHFDASSELYWADLYLDERTSNTVYVGRVRTVIDLGTGNRINGGH